MNIAYLLESTGLFGGVKVVLQQADALARRGHRVTVVSPEPAPEWFRLATEPSSVSTAWTSAPITGENARSSASGNSDSATPRSSAWRTALATASCASRNATPLRTR